VKALLLDALGTVIRLEPPAPALRAVLAQRFGIEVTEAEAARAIDAEIAYYRAHFDEGRDEASVAVLRRRCAEVLQQTLPPTDLNVAAVEEALLASLRFSPFADAAPAIEAARARGERVVIASNWDVSLHEVLERLGIVPLLDGVVTSSEVEPESPYPRSSTARSTSSRSIPRRPFTSGTGSRRT
jgi:FMN phosphatase YigB (HAD superfamily)